MREKWNRSSKKDVILIKEYIGNRRHRYTYITAEGKKYPHDEELTSLSEGIGVYNVSEKRGYRTIDGKTIILLTFSTANAGSLNLTTGKVVDAAFDFNKTDLYFDPVAKLAYARVCIGKDTHNVLVYREGYINEDGLFVIVKAPGSTY